MKQSLIERIRYRLFRRRFDRLSEYTTEMAAASGFLEAAATCLRPGRVSSDRCANCILAAEEILTRLQSDIHRDMDALLGFKRAIEEEQL